MPVITGPWRVKCGAHKKDGSPCGLWAVHGATVCHKHGAGGDPVRNATRRKAEERMRSLEARIEELGPQALEVTREIMSRKDIRPADRLKAADMVLERAAARKIAVEKAESRDRALADELEELLEELHLDPTGTEDELT